MGYPTVHPSTLTPSAQAYIEELKQRGCRVHVQHMTDRYRVRIYGPTQTKPLVKTTSSISPSHAVYTASLKMESR